jgi:hypothetical protein
MQNQRCARRPDQVPCPPAAASPEAAARPIHEGPNEPNAAGCGTPWAARARTPTASRSRRKSRGARSKPVCDCPRAMAPVERGDRDSYKPRRSESRLMRVVSCPSGGPARLPRFRQGSEPTRPSLSEVGNRRTTGRLRERAADAEGLSIFVAEVGGRTVCAGWVRFPSGTEFATLWGGFTLAGLAPTRDLSRDRRPQGAARSGARPPLHRGRRLGRQPPDPRTAGVRPGDDHDALRLVAPDQSGDRVLAHRARPASAATEAANGTAAASLCARVLLCQPCG